MPFFKNNNPLNNVKKDNEKILNKKTERDEGISPVTKKKTKIFEIKKIRNKEIEEFNEKKSKKIIYKGSKYRGVLRNGKTWQVLIMINRNKNYIGNFKSEEEAAKAYDEYAMKFHKNKARLNFSHQGFIKFNNKD